MLNLYSLEKQFSQYQKVMGLIGEGIYSEAEIHMEKDNKLVNAWSILKFLLFKNLYAQLVFQMR